MSKIQLVHVFFYNIHSTNTGKVGDIIKIMFKSVIFWKNIRGKWLLKLGARKKKKPFEKNGNFKVGQ